MTIALPLQQHPVFGDALKRLGRDIRRIDLGGDGPTQIIKRFGISFAPRGMVGADQVHLLRSSPLRIINAETRAHIYRRAGFRQVMTPAYVAELDLTGTHASRITGTHPKWRYSLRKADVKIRHDIFNAARHQWLLDADQAQQRNKGYRALPHALIHAYAVTNPADVIVFTAMQGNTPAAAMLFLQHPPVATYHIGWNSDAGRKAAAHHALLMRAADHFAAADYTRLDLGTIDTENTPGLARFKIGSGATVRALGGTWLRLPGF